jgi:7-carboxy-7-deazaguanine synthase
MRIAETFRSIQGEGRLTGTESLFVRASGCNLRCGYCDTPYASWTPEGEELSVDEILARIDDLRASPRPSFLEPVGWDEAQRRPTISRDNCGATSSHHPASSAKSLSGGRPPACGFAGIANRQQLPETRTTNPANLAKSTDVHHAVLTGGEPMLFAELIPLTFRLQAAGWHITIETSGTLYLPVACDLMSISPKLSNSTPPPERDPRWTWRHSLNRHAPDVIRRLAGEYDCQWKFVIDCPEDCDEVDSYLAEFPQIDHNRVMLMPQGIDADALSQKAAWLEPYCVQQGFQFCPRRQIEWFGAARGT